jgi:hypothetical protein
LLDHKQPLVDGSGFVDQFGQVVQAGFDIEVGGLVDHRFDPQRAAVFEVLLDAGVLVAKVDPDVGAGGEDPGLVGMLGRPAQVSGEHERDLLGTADPDVVLHEGFEEAARATRSVEHECPGHLDLARECRRNRVRLIERTYHA